MGFFTLAVLLLTTAEPFQQYVAHTDENIWDVCIQDITGDGKGEVFALCCDPKKDPLIKFIAIFSPDASGGYPDKPTFRLDVDPAISTFFFAETDGKPPAELVAVDSEGATVYQFHDGRFEIVASPRFPSLFPYKTKEPFFLKNGASDINGDGIEEWFIPLQTGFEVRTLQGPLTRVTCDVHSQTTPEGAMCLVYRLPSLSFFNAQGESSKGMAFLSDEFADFAHGPQWSKHERFKIPVNVEEKWEANTRMDDVNGDGLPDLIVTQTKGTINMRAITHIYLATAPYTYPSKPDAEYEATGALMSPLVRDVDGDGQKDIVLVNIPFGVTNIVNFFVRRKVSVHADVYLFKNGAFPKKPAFSENFLLDAPEGRERVAYTFGDFNGDGHVDVIFGAGAEQLAIHTGSSDRLVSAKPWVTLNMPAFGMAYKCNLNGNASEDLVIIHPGGPNNKRIDIVVF